MACLSWRAGLAGRRVWGTGVVLGVLAISLAAATARAQAVLTTRDLRVEIDAAARVVSLTARPDGVEYGWPADPPPVAMVYRGGQMQVASQEKYRENELPAYRGGQVFPATGARLEGDQLTVEFAEVGVRAVYRVTANETYLAFALTALEGEPVDRIDLFCLRLARLPHLGPWIDVAFDDHFGVCLCGANLQTHAGMLQQGPYVEMRAVATREAALVGATAVLFGCPDPRTRFLDAMEIVEEDFHLPAGARHRRDPALKSSYLWCSPTPDDVDDFIRLAKRAGFRMILFSYRSFTTGAGHFEFNAQFPGGTADLKRVTDAIRAAGLQVGLHIHYSKADITDRYVTPVPDERLGRVRRFTLAEPIDEAATRITVDQDPTGSARDEGRRVLAVGQELIAYRDFTTQPPYQFTGCERGYLKSAPASHERGQPVGLLDVDDWPIFVRFNQETDIQDEAAQRIAQIVRDTGPYEMLYFDGAEDVHDPFWYHVGRAQWRVYRLLDPPPPVCEAATSNHFSWHMMTRGNAWDVPGEHIKNFCRQVACRTAPVRADDFTRINFGWIIAFYPQMGPDALEYVLSRGAGWDCPISIHTGLQAVAEHPRAEDCLDVIKIWEDARIEGRLTEAQRAMLRTLDPAEYRFIRVWDAVLAPQWVDAWTHTPFQDQEHHLFINEAGEYELVPISEVADVAGGALKAYTFRRAGRPDRTYVLLWAVRGELRVRLPVASQHAALHRPLGTPLPLEAVDGGVLAAVGSRRYVVLSGMDEQEAAGVLRQATLAP